MPLSPGQTLQNHYRVDALLNQGGFGAIYRGVDLNLNRPVAIKENLDTSADAQQQFFREAQILSNLSHPNLPRVTDHFFVPGIGQYLVMDFVEGEDLQSMLDRTRCPLPEAQALAWIGQVCSALAYLHSQTPPIVHRDIKPANIKITPQGQAMLVDFGIAKVYDAQMKTTLGARAVTAPYSPPEQYGADITDPRSDIYALGVTLYVLLTGYQPPESVVRIANGVPMTPPRQLMPSMTPSVEAAILRACDVSKTQRFASVQDFQKSLFAAPPLPRTIVLPGQPPTPAWGSAQPSAPPASWGTPMPVWNTGQPSSPEATWIAPAATPAAAPAPMWNIPVSTPVPSWSAPIPAKPKRKTALWVVLALLLLIPIALAGAYFLKLPPFGTQGPIGGTSVPENDGMVLLPVPAGEFVMGSNNSGVDNEQPEHTVYLDAYFIDQTEVTNAMFQKFVNATGYRTDAEKSGKGWGAYNSNTKQWEETPGASWLHPNGPTSNQAGPNYPVVQVSWNDATAYCAWAGRRLPTEAEWEKAARGADRRAYPWGNAAPDATRLNFAGNVGDTTVVGQYPNGASPYGAFDMAGNVWEWAADWYSDTYYASAPTRNPTGPTSGDTHVVRGGSWGSGPAVVRVSVRRSGAPDYQHISIGFRCARNN